MTSKLLILYKTTVLNNLVFNLTSSYCNNFENVKSYFIYCDENIEKDVLVENNLIKIKLKEDNWQSLLVKVVKSFELFKTHDYTHIMVTNISTIVNIPIIYKMLSNSKCMSVKGCYKFNNIDYNFPSGAGYIFNIDLVNNICDFFDINNYLINNKLTNDFLNNYPSTDDVFFGYYLKINKIEIDTIDRLDVINSEVYIKAPHYNYSHFRIKTGNVESDYRCFSFIIKNIYIN